jgi:hypothetical protein
MSKSKHPNFVAYKESLALKDKDFKDKCDAHFDRDKDLLLGKSMYNRLMDSDGRVDAPTWTQVFSWFARTYKLASHVDLYSINHLGENYYFKIKNFTDSFEDGAETKAYGFKTPEDAQLACLRKLIEYVS